MCEKVVWQGTHKKAARCDKAVEGRVAQEDR